MTVMWIRTKDDWYVCEIRSSGFITWVEYKDKANARHFPISEVDEWLILIAEYTGKEIEAVEPFA